MQIMLPEMNSDRLRNMLGLQMKHEGLRPNTTRFVPYYVLAIGLHMMWVWAYSRLCKGWYNS